MSTPLIKKNIIFVQSHAYDIESTTKQNGDIGMFLFPETNMVSGFINIFLDAPAEIPKNFVRFARRSSNIQRMEDSLIDPAKDIKKLVNKLP